MVSYNLLANIYAHTNFSQTVLFGYCPKWALDFDYRKHVLMREILGEFLFRIEWTSAPYPRYPALNVTGASFLSSGYNGDIMCFQEVDRSMYTKDLQPCLSLRDFDGVYCEKSGNNSEG